MMRLLLLAILLLPADICWGQVRSAGLAGAGSAITSGVDAPLSNPARLTSADGPRLRLIDTFGALSNSSYSISDYRTYNGADLSEEDEDALLAKIDGDGLEARGILSASGFAYRHRSWAIGMRVQGDAGTKIPKDAIRLLLDGNRPEETFAFDAAAAAGELIGEIRLSHAREIDIPGAGQVNLGASLKWFRGWYYAGIEEASGVLSTDIAGVNANGEVRLRTATGGHGFGFDLGAWREFDSSWSMSVAVTNIFAGIRLTHGTEETLTRVSMEDLNLQNLDDDDDLIDSEDETYSIGSFRSSIPPRLTMGPEHHHGRWTFVADWTQGFEESLRSTRTPRLAIGTEVRTRGWIVGRAGFSVGGLDHRSLSMGLGLTPGMLHLDFALVASNGLFPFTGRGIGAGLGVGLDF